MSNRKERKSQTTIESFNCDRLGGIAQVKIYREICVHEDSRDNHTDGVVFKDCANKFDCGLYVWQNKPYSFKAVEDVSRGCSAQRIVNASGDL